MISAGHPGSRGPLRYCWRDYQSLHWFGASRLVDAASPRYSLASLAKQKLPLTQGIGGEAYFRRELCASKWVSLDSKNSSKHSGNSLKQLTLTCPWAHILEGLIIEWYLQMRYGGIIFGRGGGGGGVGRIMEFYGILLSGVTSSLADSFCSLRCHINA